MSTPNEQNEPGAEPTGCEPEDGSSGDELALVESDLVRVLEAGAERRDGLLAELERAAPERARAVRRRLALLDEFGFSPEPRAAALRTFGGYRLLARIGGGGMGEVHLAQDERGERAAVKLLRSDHLWFEGARARFLREIASTSRLTHPGIVETFAAGEEDGVPWLAMRYVAGASLADVLTELAHVTGAARDGEGAGAARAVRDPRTLTRVDFLDALGACARRAGVEQVVMPDGFPGTSYAALVANIVARVASALEHAHDKGVIHRDVKPSNVLLTPSGEVLLADFGLALPSEAGRLTRTGSWLGSLPYAAPEQLDGRAGRVDARVDVYALGVTLHELLALRTPFLGGGEQEVRRRIARGALERMSRVNPSVSRGLSAVCEKACDLDPGRRYASAGELAQDLERAARGRPVVARRAPGWLRTTRLARRHPAASTGIGLVLLVALASVGFALRERAVTRRIERLSDASEMRRLTAEAQTFWPSGAERSGTIERWLVSAQVLLDRRAVHERERETLRARALPYSAAERAADRAQGIELLATLALEIRGLDGFVARDQPFAALPPLPPEVAREVWEDARRRIAVDFEAFVADLELEMTALRERMQRRPDLWTPDMVQFHDFDFVLKQERARLSERATWTLSDPVQRWQSEELDRLLDDLDAFEGLVERVRRRRDVLAHLDTNQDAWPSARAEIAASPRYAGLQLEPLVGLTPLGFDPASGLFEFLVIGTGPAPAAAPTDANPGGRAFDGGTGIVLVLVPGGRFRMGNRPGEETAQERRVPAPLHDVVLEPFLIAKTELTVGQAVRLGGLAPDDLRPFAHDLPLSVDWEKGRALLRMHGLDLPSEAQWELVARAGEDGPRRASLQGYANVCDQAWERINVGRGSSPGCAFDDGYGESAPVGSYLPNAWGVYDLFGNVGEWCGDWSIGRGYSTLPSRPGNGLKGTVLNGLVRAVRGGAYSAREEDCHAGRLSAYNPSTFSHSIGLRPVRAIR